MRAAAAGEARARAVVCGGSLKTQFSACDVIRGVCSYDNDDIRIRISAIFYLKRESRSASSPLMPPLRSQALLRARRPSGGARRRAAARGGRAEAVGERVPLAAGCYSAVLRRCDRRHRGAPPCTDARHAIWPPLAKKGKQQSGSRRRARPRAGSPIGAIPDLPGDRLRRHRPHGDGEPAVQLRLVRFASPVVR